jgi:hypothetical protein
MTTNEETFTQQFSDYGAWGREALRVALLASEMGVSLNKEMIILSDVRDLQALRARLLRGVSSNAPYSGGRAVSVTESNALLHRLGEAVRGLRKFL